MVQRASHLLHMSMLRFTLKIVTPPNYPFFGLHLINDIYEHITQDKVTNRTERDTVVIRSKSSLRAKCIVILFL